MKMTSENRIAFFAFIIFSPSFVNGASISVANARHSLDWNHLISKRATTDTKPTETKNDTEITTEHRPLLSIEPEHRLIDEPESQDDRTVDWQLLGGNPDNLNEELNERRRRRSIVAQRVANKLESVRENRQRSKRDLYRIYDDDRDDDADDDANSDIGIDIDSNGDVELTEKDLENLEKLIRQIQQMNQRENVVDDNDDDDGIDVNDLAYGQDGSSYFEPDTVSSNDGVYDEKLPLVVQLVDTERPSNNDDGDDDDENDDDRYYGPKDKRDYPASTYGDVDDDRADDDVWLSPSTDNSQDIDQIANDDDSNTDVSVPSYLIEGDDDDSIDDIDEDEARKIRIEILKGRIKQLAQYINDNYRRR
jgi:hypothetical protein